MRYIFLIIAILSLLCCNSGSKEPSVVSPVSQLSVNQPFDLLEITGSFEEMTLTVNGLSIFDPLGPLDGLSDAEKADKVFAFLSENFVVWNADLGKKESIYLYGYGYGLCGTESRVMCALWNEVGLDARTVAWDRHTMAEAKVDGDWQIFDAQHRINFSKNNQKTVSFEDLQTQSDLVPAGLDPIGYGSDYLRELFAQAKPVYSNSRSKLAHPKLSLTSGQTLQLRKRPSNSPYPLFLTEQPDTKKRSHLVPLYELTLVHQSTGDPAVFYTGLPLLGIEMEGLSLKVNGENKLDIQNLAKDLRGSDDPIELHVPEGVTIKLVYAMANWCGDRIFSARKGSLLALHGGKGEGNFKLHRFTDVPELNLTAFDVTPMENGQYQAELNLKWSNMPTAGQLTYQIFLDELGSGLPLEAWQYIRQEDWVWRAEMGAHGEATLVFPWNPPKNTSRYRPSNYRTLLAHLKGPGVDSYQEVLRKDL